MWKFSGQSVGTLLTCCQIQDKEKQGAQVLPGMRTGFGSQKQIYRKSRFPQEQSPALLQSLRPAKAQNKAWSYCWGSHSTLGLLGSKGVPNGKLHFVRNSRSINLNIHREFLTPNLKTPNPQTHKEAQYQSREHQRGVAGQLSWGIWRINPG